MLAGRAPFIDHWTWTKAIVDFNDLPDEVKLPMIAAVGGSIVAAFNHFSDTFKRKSRRADISVFRFFDSDTDRPRHHCELRRRGKGTTGVLNAD